MMLDRKIISTEECPMTGDITVFYDDATAYRMDRREARHNLLGAISDAVAHSGSSGRVDVFQYGRKVGEMPAWWHPGLAKSSSPMFDYRRGDLALQDGRWVAAKGLGAGDLDCLIGFVRKGQAHD